MKGRDVKVCLYEGKEGRVVGKVEGVEEEEKVLEGGLDEEGLRKEEEGKLEGSGKLGGMGEMKEGKRGEEMGVFVRGER